MFQSTVRKPVVFDGIGLHGGKRCHVEISPLPPDSGVWFAHRQDRSRIHFPALVSYALPFSLATCVGPSVGESIKTVEHVLSALHGLGIDNALLTVEGGEVPILDGSADPFVQGISDAGVEVSSQERLRVCLPPSPVFQDGNSSICYKPGEGSGLVVAYRIDFPHPMIGCQTHTTQVTPELYCKNIAPARTFGFERDGAILYSRNLALGASLANTIVLTEDGMRNAQPLRYSDEFVRHKICDLIGDLALSGVCLEGIVTVNCGGHRLHAQLARWVYCHTEGKYPTPYASNW